LETSSNTISLSVGGAVTVADDAAVFDEYDGVVVVDVI
jgi:hypothetical protein